MQRPRALTGNLIDTGWFQRYETLPILTHRAVYVDTNSGKVEDYNDYTVFSLVGVDRENLYLIDSVRGRWDPEDLLKRPLSCGINGARLTRVSPPLFAIWRLRISRPAGLITTLKSVRASLFWKFRVGLVRTS